MFFMVLAIDVDPERPHLFSRSSDKWSVNIFIILSILSISIFGFAGEAGTYFALSKDQKECFSYSEDIRKKPEPISKKFNIEPEFLAAHPLCQNQVSCLDPARSQQMKGKGLLPGGLGASSMEALQKNPAAPPKCLARDPLSNFSALHETGKSLLEDPKLYPPEAYLAQKLVVNTKRVVTDYLKDSEKASAVLIKCFEHNELMEKDNIPFYKRLEKAQSDKNIPKVCQRIWKPDSEISNLFQKNKELRQTLAAIELINNGKFKTGEQVLDIGIDLKDQNVLSPFYKNLLNKKLSPPKIKFFGIMAPSQLWDGTPNELEALNEFEKKGLVDVIAKHLDSKESKTPIEDLKSSLSSHYFDLLNENPILLEFSSARPNASELKTAFQNNQRKIQNLRDFKISNDVDYLAFSSALSFSIEASPPEEQGSACVLAHEMLRLRKDVKEAPINLALSLMALESLGTGIAAKGALKKTLGFLMGARYSGSAYQALTINQGLETIRTNTESCLKTSINSNGLCRVDQLQQATTETAISSVLLGTFGVPKKSLKIIAPTILGGDQLQK